tara:strand:- start:5901 stop:13214 length:7314 start_codon:yes stop_codon:yes gene_type:complete
MAKIKNTTAYPTVTPNASDLLIATDVSDNNKTVTFLVSDFLAAGTILQDLQSVLTTGDTAIEDINLTGTIDLTGTLELAPTTLLTIGGVLGTGGQVLSVNSTATGLEWTSSSGIQTWDDTVAQGNTVTGRVLNAQDSSMNFVNTALTLGSLTGSEFTSFLWAGPSAINNNLDLGDPTGNNAYAVNFYTKQKLTVDGAFGLAGEFLAVNTAADGLEWSSAPTQTTPNIQAVLTEGNTATSIGIDYTGTVALPTSVTFDANSGISSQGSNSFSGHSIYTGLGITQTDAAISIDLGSRIYLGNNTTGSVGTAGQVFAINAAGTGMEWSSTAAGQQDLQSVLNNGGTADSTLTNNASIYLTGNGDSTASATNGIFTIENGTLSIEDTELLLDGDVGTAGQVLISGGANAGPSWSAAGTGSGTVTSVGVTDSTYIDLSVGSSPTVTPNISAAFITDGSVTSGVDTDFYNATGAFSAPLGADWDLSFSKTGTPASSSNLSSTGATGYTTATGVGTSSSPGSGLLVNITASAGEVTVIDALGGAPTGYSVGDTITIIQGGSSNNATFQIASVTTNTVGLTNSDGTRSSVVNIDAGTNISMTVDASNDLTLSSTSGGGSVNSVGVSSNYLSVGSSPVTSSGTISVDMPTSGVTAGSYTAANVTVTDKGIVTAISDGSTTYQLGAGAGLTNSIISNLTPGTGYTPGIYQTTSSGSGRGFAINILTVVGNGEIDSFSIVQNGSGYVDSEVITITGGNGDATFAAGTVPNANQIVLSGNGTDDAVTLTGTGGTTITTTANSITIDSSTGSGLSSFVLATSPASNAGLVDVTNNTLTFIESVNTINSVDYSYVSFNLGTGLDINKLTGGLTASTASLTGTTVTQSYLRADNTWSIPPNTEYSLFTGASSQPAPGGTDGTLGLVPAPIAANSDYNKFLKGDGTWGTPSGSGTLTGVSVSAPLTVDSATDPAIPALDINDFTGPDTVAPANGSRGVVPTPLVADDGKFLSTAGWTTAPGEVYTSTNPIDIDATTNVISLNYSDSPNNLIETAPAQLVPGVTNKLLITDNSKPNKNVETLTLEGIQYVMYTSGTPRIEITDNTNTANVKLGVDFNSFATPYTNIPPSKIKYVDSTGISVSVVDPVSGSIDPTINFGLDTFIGATSLADGDIGAVPKPLIAERGYFLRANGTWAPNFSYFAWRMSADSGTSLQGVIDGKEVLFSGGTGINTVGGTVLNAYKLDINLQDFTAPDVPGGNPGLKGGVPAPQVADDGKFLSTAGWTTMAGGGTVTSVSGTLPIQVDNTTNPAIPAVSVDNFTGATNAPANGTKGTVPAPQASTQDYDKFLKGDGTWSAATTSFSFDISDDASVPVTQTITDGNTITFKGGTDITSAVSATDIVTFSHDAITRTDPTAGTTTPGSGGTFTSVSSITSSAQGHITAVQFDTVTMPTSDDYQNWIFAGDSGNDQTISSTNTLTLNGTGGITVVGGSTGSDQANVTLNSFTGASNGVDGAAGGVPQPLGITPATDYDKFLKGDGTWDTPVTSYSWSADADNAAGISIINGAQVKWVGGVGMKTTIATAVPNTITSDLDVNKLTASVVSGLDYLAGEEVAGGTTVKFLINDLPFTDNAGTVTAISGSGGTTGLTLTPNVGTPITSSGTLTLGGTLITANGGTGIGTYAIGDILFASATDTLSALNIGTAGQVLTVNSNANGFLYTSPTDGTVTSVGINADNGAGTGITGSGAFTFNGGTLMDTSVTGNTVTFNHESVTRTNSTSSANVAVGGTIAAVDTLSSDASGHVTDVNTKSFTLPSAFGGATAVADGTAGFVPKPIALSDDVGNYLRGDGTWSLAGLVTSIVAGTGITVSGTGAVTVNATNNGTVTSVNLTGNTGTGSAITSSGTFDIDGLTSASSGSTTDHYNGINTVANAFNLDIKGFAIPDENEYWFYRANAQTGSSAMGLEKSIVYGYDDAYKSLAVANGEVGKQGYTLVLGASVSSRAYIFNAGNTTYRWSNSDAAGISDSSTNSVYIGASAGNGATGNSNSIGIGSNALLVSSTGADNIALGTNSGQAITTGARNILVGTSAGQALPAANDNVAIGDNSLYNANNVTASQNVAIGTRALNFNKGGINNVAIGYSALSDALEVQTRNVAIGSFAGMESFGGADVAIGHEALVFGSNATPNPSADEETARVAIGISAMKGGGGGAEVQGLGNVAIGGHAGEYNSTSVAGGAVYVGHYAGQNENVTNTTFTGMVAIGKDAMRYNTPNSGIAIGLQAMQDKVGATSIGGNSNIAIGVQAMFQATVTGDDNIGIGRLANNTTDIVTDTIAIGNSSKAKGTCTIAIGCNAQGGASATSINSVAIGASSDADGDQAVALGFNASADGEDSIAIGNASAISDNSVAIGEGAQTNNANEFAIGSAVQNVGLTEASTTFNQSARWTVKINGVNYYIPLDAV